MKVSYTCIYLLMRKKTKNLLSREDKMKTPYTVRKLTIKTGVNAFKIFDIIFVAIKILRQKS